MPANGVDPSAMKSDHARTTEPDGAPDAAPALLADLRLRLLGRETQLLAARAEARRLARELVLARRLLRFSCAHQPPACPAPVAGTIPRVRAAPLAEPMVYHLDVCENRGTHVAISGWAFRPVPSWDGRAGTATLLFRHGATVYQAAAGRVPRPDVAAHYAAQPVGLAGGARGLDGAGFACEVLHDSLPAGVDLEIALRLEGAGAACEQPLGRRLRL